MRLALEVGKGLADDDVINQALEQSYYMIQNYLELDAIITAPDRYVYTLGKIQCDICEMFIARIRMNKEQNLLTEAVSFWQYQPSFTREHIRTLNMIKSKLKSPSHAISVRDGTIK